MCYLTCFCLFTLATYFTRFIHPVSILDFTINIIMYSKAGDWFLQNIANISFHLSKYVKLYHFSQIPLYYTLRRSPIKLKGDKWILHGQKQLEIAIKVGGSSQFVEHRSPACLA